MTDKFAFGSIFAIFAMAGGATILDNHLNQEHQEKLTNSTVTAQFESVKRKQATVRCADEKGFNRVKRPESEDQLRTLINRGCAVTIS